MARKHPPRHGAAPALAGIRRSCASCPAIVSRSRLWCPSCWSRLASAPGGLRERLRTPDGAFTLPNGGKDYRADVDAAKAFLAKVTAGESR